MSDQDEGLTVQLVPQQNHQVNINQILPPEQKRIKLFHQNFSCSEHDHDPNNLQIPERGNFEPWEADTYRYEFNLPMFIQSLFLFLIDVSGLGFITFLYDLIFRSNFLHNLYNIGIVNLFLNKLGMVNTLFLIYSILQRNFVYTDANSLSYIVQLVFYSIMGAALNSYINSKIPPLMHQTKFSTQSLLSTGAFFHDYDGDEEFKRTVLRLNFDASSFFMTFLDKTKEEFNREPGPNYPATMQEEGDKLVLVLDEGSSKEDLAFYSLEFEDAVFNYKFLRKPSRFDQNKAYGFRYAQKILKTNPRKSRGFYFIVVFAVIGLIALNFLRLDGAKHDSESFIQKYLVGGAVLLLNIAVTVGIISVMIIGADVLWTRLEILKGMAELISEEQPAEGSVFRKDCSMINILDAESLRTWAGLRRIFMNMYQRRLDSIGLAISLIVAIQAIIIVVLGFFYFTAVDSTQKDFFLQYIIFFGAPAIFYMTFVLLFIYVGSKVNNQYQEHIHLLKKLKTAIVKLFALYPNFNGVGSVQPTTYLYARGVRYLNQSFGDQEVTQELLDERLEKISNAYEEVITDLENEEQYSPLKILGIPMTNSLVTTIFGFIVTVVMAPVTKYITEITGLG